MSDQTHIQALLHELAAHGQVTYQELCARYPSHTLMCFRAVVSTLARRGLLHGPKRRGGPIVGVACPCCGRPFAAATATTDEPAGADRTAL